MLKELFLTLGIVDSIIALISIVVVLFILTMVLTWIVYFISCAWHKGREEAYE